MTPYHDYSKQNTTRQSIAEELIKHGADVNLYSAMGNSGYTPIYLAVSSGCLDLVDVFVANGADLSLTYEDAQGTKFNLLDYTKNTNAKLYSYLESKHESRKLSKWSFNFRLW